MLVVRKRADDQFDLFLQRTPNASDAEMSGYWRPEEHYLLTLSLLELKGLVANCQRLLEESGEHLH